MKHIGNVDTDGGNGHHISLCTDVLFDNFQENQKLKPFPCFLLSVYEEEKQVMSYLSSKREYRK